MLKEFCKILYFSTKLCKKQDKFIEIAAAFLYNIKNIPLIFTQTNQSGRF